MQITLTVPDELTALARARGLTVEAYVQGLVEEARSKSLSPSLTRSSREIESFLDAMSQKSQSLPTLPTDSFAREGFY